MLEFCVKQNVFLYAMIAAGIAGVWCLFWNNRFYTRAIRDLGRLKEPKSKWTRSVLETCQRKAHPFSNAGAFMRSQIAQGRSAGMAVPTLLRGSQNMILTVLVKLNAISSTVKGKRVVLVDDSIVRGTTSARIIKLLRDAGATEVHFMVSAPPFKYPCYFGTDIPDQKLLVATGRTVDQINGIIGADTLGYLSTEHVVQLAKNANCGFCTACFTGEYAVKPDEVLSTDIHERHLNDRPKDEKKLGE